MMGAPSIVTVFGAFRFRPQTIRHIYVRGRRIMVVTLRRSLKGFCRQ